MKMSLSQIIAIACILTIGFIGLFSLATSTNAHYLRIDYTHTNIDCYESFMLGDLPMLNLCDSFTRTRAKHIYPSNHYTETSEEWNHNAHAQEPNTHATPSDNETYPDCGWCASEKEAAEKANAHHPPPPDE